MTREERTFAFLTRLFLGMARPRDLHRAHQSRCGGLPVGAGVDYFSH
jgi:hypothetical protein